MLYGWTPQDVFEILMKSFIGRCYGLSGQKQYFLFHFCWKKDLPLALLKSDRKSVFLKRVSIFREFQTLMALKQFLHTLE